MLTIENYDRITGLAYSNDGGWVGFEVDGMPEAHLYILKVDADSDRYTIYVHLVGELENGKVIIHRTPTIMNESTPCYYKVEFLRGKEDYVIAEIGYILKDLSYDEILESIKILLF